MDTLVSDYKPAASKIIIEGGRPVIGEIRLQGSKNAALPMLVASVLNKGITRINNCPDIGDVEDILQLLKEIGCKVQQERASVMVDATVINKCEISKELAAKTRGSFLILGALLARERHATVYYPGGCPIGTRPVDMHLDALKKMGMELLNESSEVACAVFNKKANVSIKFPYPSVGATQNAILAATLGEGSVILKNCAREPEIAELCRMLNAMGADIFGEGTSVIRINGVNKLHDIEWTIKGDRIVAGTYMTAALITDGSLTIRGVSTEQIRNEMDVFSKAGASITMWEDVLHIRRKDAGKVLRPIRSVVTKPYPGFATDMQSQIMSLLVFADGRSVIKETVFENRFKIVEELAKMGANITISGRLARIRGVAGLCGANISARDLRGGASLVLAALGAEGISVVDGYSHIRRGYENFVSNLAMLGVTIKESV